jgi:ABC-2 type transport system permease protein
MLPHSIKRKLKIYSAYLKTDVQAQFEYRLDFFLYTIAALVSPIIGLAVWLAASNSGAKLLLDKDQLITYFALVLFVGTLNQTWHAWYVDEDINTGNFSKFLLKPFYLADEYFMKEITDKIFKLFFTSVLFIAAIFIFHISFKGVYLDLVTLTLFLVSLILSFGIAFYLESIIGISTFWLHSIDFLKDLESIANQVLTGRLIPLVFFPVGLASFISFTPFRYVVSFPIEILMHKATGTTLLFGFTLQIFWFIAMIFLYKYLYNKGVVKFQAYG